MTSRADFHCHSTASDGVLPPGELVELAHRQGVRILALTDHDSAEGVAEARRAAERYPDFTVIPGVEMGTDIPGAEVHVLGYFLDPDDPALQDTLRRLPASRIASARRRSSTVFGSGWVVWTRMMWSPATGPRRRT